MAYKLYGRQVFRAEVGGKKYTFTCYSQNTSYGFTHVCTDGYNNTTERKWIRSRIIAKACYYNRTWESFQYETVLKKGIENLCEPQEVKDKLYAILITKTAQDEHEKVEKEVAQFETLWNGRSSADYLPGKKGQNIGIRIREITKHTMTRPVPHFT